MSKKEQPAAKPALQWEYTTTDGEKASELKLNERGQEGWELVSVLAFPGSSARLLAVFKRQLPGKP